VIRRSENDHHAKSNEKNIQTINDPSIPTVPIDNIIESANFVRNANAKRFNNAEPKQQSRIEDAHLLE
jgi:hypothetical protein